MAWVVLGKVQQECSKIVDLEPPARVMSRKVGILLGQERAGRGPTPERAMLVPVMEVAAARSRDSCRHSWGGGRPPTPQDREGG